MSCCNCGGDGKCHNSIHDECDGSFLDEVIGVAQSVVFKCDDCGSHPHARGDCAHCDGTGDCDH